MLQPTTKASARLVTATRRPAAALALSFSKNALPWWAGARERAGSSRDSRSVLKVPLLSLRAKRTNLAFRERLPRDVAPGDDISNTLAGVGRPAAGSCWGSEGTRAPGLTQFPDQNASVPAAIAWAGASPATSNTNTRDPVGVCPLRRSKDASGEPVTTSRELSGDQGE